MSEHVGRENRGERIGDLLATLRPFLPHLWVQRRRLAGAYALTGLCVVLGMALPWPMKFLIDEVLAPNGAGTGQSAATDSPTAAVLLLAAAIALLASVSAFVLSLEKVMHAKVREQFTTSLRGAVIEHIYRLSLSARQSNASGELALRLGGDTQLVSRLLCKTVPFAVRDLAVAGLLLAAIAWIDLRIGGVALIVTVALGTIVVHYGPRLAQASATKRRREGELAALAQQSIVGVEHVQAMGLETRARARYMRDSERSLGAGVDEVRVAVQMERAAQIFSGLAVGSIAGLGGLRVLSGELSLGTLTVCLAYLTQLLKPIEKLNEIGSDMTRGLVRARRLVGLLSAECAIQEGGNARLEESLEAIRCDGLEFTYPGSTTPTISGFSHLFRIGECTVLTGPSGSGKSTLLRLLLRVLTPQKGTICANDVPYIELAPEALRANFAVLMQSAHLFSGTVREVLTELRPAASDSEIEEALHGVGLARFVADLPAGLETQVDEAGGRFSGGQKARLLLARALLSARPLVILDEPFANIDVISKRIILDALRRIKAQRILVAVTHDEVLLEIADHLLSAPRWSPVPARKRAPLNRSAATPIASSQ